MAGRGNDPIELALRHWGAVYGEPRPDEWQEDSSDGSGTLTGCLIEFLRVGIVSGKEPDNLTARGKQSQGGSRPMKVHPVADRIDHLVCLLYAEDRRAAVCLRADYCLQAKLTDKCAWVGMATDSRVSRMGFRAAVARGRLYLHHILTAKKAG